MIERAEYEITLKNSRFLAGLKSAEKNVDVLESKLKDLGSNIGSALAVGSLVAFGREAFLTSTKVQSLRNSITFASGSAKEGAENLKFISDLSKEMGLNLLATTEGFRTFSGALIGSKFEGEKARDIFRKISTGIATMGLSADDAKGAFLAIGQMVSKGTVSAEELRGQLGERLPGAFQIAARSLGVTTSKLGDMLKQGEVITEDFLPKFADEMEKTFGKGVAKAAQSQAADLAKLENKWHEYKDLMGSVVAPVIHSLVSEEKSLNDQFQDQRLKVNGLQQNVQPLINRYNDLSQKTSLNKDETLELKNITKELAQALPQAVTEWNKYGEAIKLSGFAMDQLVTKNKEALKILNREAIAEKEEELNGFVRKAMLMQKILADGTSGKYSDDFLRRASSELQGLTGEGGIIPMLRAQIDNLQGGNRDKELQEGLKARDAKFSSWWRTSTDAASGATTKGKSSSGGSAGVEKIASGTRNVTLNISQLVGEIKFEKSIERSEAQMVDMVKRVLLTAVNDTNIVAQ